MTPPVPLALFDVGAPEALMVFFAVLILFGGQRLPELARGLGRSIREFKKASAGVEQEIKRAIESAPDTSSRPATHVSSVATRPTAPLPLSKPAVPPIAESPAPPFQSEAEPKP